MWKKLYLNKNNIENRTARAVLIKIPKSDLKFWHPSKLIREEGGKGYHLSLSYTEEWEFRVFKNGKGKYNKYDIVYEDTLSCEDIESYFENSSNSISTSVAQENESFFEVEEPKKIDKEVEVVDELRNK